MSVHSGHPEVLCLYDILERICSQDPHILKQTGRSVIGSEVLTAVVKKSYVLWNIIFACFLLISYSSTLKMELLLSSDMLVDFRSTTWHPDSAVGVTTATGYTTERSKFESR
jgi:hypothetical protein